MADTEEMDRIAAKIEEFPIVYMTGGAAADEWGPKGGTQYHPFKQAVCARATFDRRLSASERWQPADRASMSKKRT